MNTRPPARTLLELVPLAPVGPSDGETNPAALLPGDLVRWLGVWHAVLNVRHRTLDSTTFLDLYQPETDTTRLVFYRPGCWVAAIPAPRPEEAAA